MKLRARLLRRLSSILLVSGTALGAGCVSPFSREGGDLELAPFYTRVSKAGGGTAGEALLGAVVAERDQVEGPVQRFALRPLFAFERAPDGEPGPVPAANTRWRLDYLYPLGRTISGERTSSSWLLPLYHWRSRETAHSGRRSTLLALPGIWWARDEAGGGSFAWFPFYGRVEDFATYEEIRFFLFPLYSSAERDGKRSKHILYPFFGWTRGGGEKSTRVFPFWVHSEVEGFYNRTSVLWPFIHWQTNDLQRGEASTEHRWMVWPLFGRSRRGTYRSTTLLWPFFGWASDPRADFWALDAPWPFVRLQSGGENPLAAKRRRFWPFWSHFETDRLEWTTWAWPFVHLRRETLVRERRRDSFRVFPFWQSFETRFEPGSDSDSEEARAAEGRAEGDHEAELLASWWKLWPIAQRRVENDRTRLSFLAPFPFHWDSAFDFSWNWPFELWAAEEAPAIRRERAWGGLWRRERDAFEDRRYLSFLYSGRSYRRNGARVHETALLFGLLRWRSMEGEGFEMLAPAFPGPGWPARRSNELRHEEPLPESDVPSTP